MGVVEWLISSVRELYSDCCLAARDWKRVNEGLVRRGEILLDLRIVDRWDSELERMNARKEGGRYVYPEIFVKLLGYVHLLFHLPYRQTEGVLTALRRVEWGVHVPYES